MEIKKARAHTRYKNKKDKIVPGVTTVLNLLSKPALIPWANKLGLEGIDVTKYVDDKADIGTLAHDMIHCHLSDKEADTSEYSAKQISQAENCLISFYDWLKTVPMKPILLEEKLVSEKHQYGGSIDCYADILGKKVLVDFKTGKAIYDNMAYQLSAYRNLLEENGHEVDYAVILNIPRAETENFAVRRWDNTDLELKIFQNCLKIYKLEKQIRKGSKKHGRKKKRRV